MALVRDIAALHVEHRWHYRAVIVDPGTEKGARADARLRSDLVAWLITVSADGQPVPTPVWFWWDGDTILVYSERDKPKLRHIAANPRVAFALRTNELGSRSFVLTSRCRCAPAASSGDCSRRTSRTFSIWCV